MASQKFTCAFLVAAILVAVGQVDCKLPYGFLRCDDTSTVVKSFATNACPSGVASADSPCTLKYGQHAVFELFFSSATDYSNKVSSHLEMDGFSYKSDACQGPLGLKCPGEAGEMTSIIMPYDVDTSIKPRSLDTMKVYLTDDESQKVLVCVQFPVKITA